jgi:hypothetical protein
VHSVTVVASLLSLLWCVACRFGRDLAYAPFAAELLVVGSAPEVWRISLAEGRFMKPLPSKSPAINAAGEGQLPAA